MTKTIIKELIITLLICLAIILVLGVVLYGYAPTTKTIPNQVSYTTPSEVKEELVAAGEVDESQVVMTYEINSSDLNDYKRIKNYKPGKANPFSSYESQTSGSNTTTNSASNGGTTENGSNQANTSENSNNQTTTSGGNFFQDKGTK